jgi:hypothetical protein
VPEEVAAAPAESTPEEVIEGFYRWYAGYPGNPLADGILASHPAVHQALVEKVDTILDAFENSPGGHDPVLCAQDRPRDFRVEIVDRSTDSATATVYTEFEGHRIYVGVAKVDGAWMIADITCPIDPSSSLPEEERIEPGAPTSIPTPTIAPADQEPEGEGPREEQSGDEPSENDPTADWPIFHDEAYGFQIAYPPGWGFMDLSVYDPGAGGPPTIIERIVMLYPQVWEERLRPGSEPDPNVDSYPALSIQVCLGTLEAYRREFMELGAHETIEINGLSVLHEWDTHDDYNIAQYMFQHPADGELRITLTDAVSGFSKRAEENGDVVALIPVMVSTFRFTE